MKGLWATVPFLAFLFACSLVPLNNEKPFPLTLPIVKDFETGDLSGFYPELARSSGATLVTSPTYAGTYSAKISVDPGDIQNHGNRAELALYNCAQFGDTVFFGWRFQIPAGDPDGFQWQIMAQLYQLPNFELGETFDFFYAHPPVTFTYTPGYVEVQANVGTPGTLGKTSITKGVWHLAVMEIRFKDDSSGFVQAWVDGTPITPFNGTDYRVYRSTLHNRAGCYFKVGLYRGYQDQTQATSSNALYLDNVCVGRSYVEVSP